MVFNAADEAEKANLYMHNIDMAIPIQEELQELGIFAEVFPKDDVKGIKICFHRLEDFNLYKLCSKFHNDEKYSEILDYVITSVK